MRKSYFAAANTENGFVSLFDKIFSPKSLSHLYIIKGGPGTGKSTFMYGIAAAAEERGLETEYYYCSADTGSLDGVKIPALGVAMIDGTAPHTVDPRYPGSCETIINLGENFDVPKLKENREEIISLTDRCSEYYSAARRFLRAAGEMKRSSLENAAKAFDFAKAKKAAARMLLRTDAAKGEVSERYISAVGVRGKVHFETSEKSAERVVRVTGKYGFPTLFMSVLMQAVLDAGLCAERYPDVLLRERTEAILVGGTLFAVSEKEAEDGEESVNSMRFVMHEELSFVRGKLRFAGKCCEALEEGALESLFLMGKTHDELEKYYISAMDFSANEKILQKIIGEIFDRV